MIAAELVDVAAGLIDAKELMDAALRTLNAGGPVGERENLTSVFPRKMPFTEGLGIELLILDQAIIDTLSTLRSNLPITSMGMEAVTEGRQRFALFGNYEPV